MNYKEAYEKLEKDNQQHVLKYYEELDEQAKEALLEQVEKIDLSIKDNLYKEEEDNEISAIKVLDKDGIEQGKDNYKSVGIKALKEGRVAAVILAGGMGTRLGVNYPKGMYDVGMTKSKYIFQCLIENILDVVRACGEYLEVFIMTSKKNHEATTKFFDENDYFGYKKDKINFFIQNEFFTTDVDGKILLEDKGVISTSPNGNGGWYNSLVTSSVKDKLENGKIEWLNIVSVDNVLQRICDPVFVGATIESGYNAGSKVVKKFDGENVGVMCNAGGVPSVIEYYELENSDLDKELIDELCYGVILNYLFNKKKLDEVMNESLPIHCVKKKIKVMNDETIEGLKYETLATDLIGLMETCLPYEVIRENEFAPIKNLHGKDSVDTARELLVKNGVCL